MNLNIMARGARWLVEVFQKLLIYRDFHNQPWGLPRAILKEENIHRVVYTSGKYT